jgi:dTDP-4-dehydrorhamnose 3,5-epimerase-like enzyme
MSYYPLKTKKQMWIPEVFAHAFVTLSDTTEVLYKMTGFYSKEHSALYIGMLKSLGLNGFLMIYRYPLKMNLLRHPKKQITLIKLPSLMF